MHLAATVVALVVISGSVLAMGKGMRIMMDEGLTKANAGSLDHAFWLLMLVVAVLAISSYARVLLTNYIGESVVADIRRDVYRRVIAMHIGFFETTSTGELLSRMASDTMMLQGTLSGNAATSARNLMIFFGGVTMMLVTSARLTGYVCLIVPLVVFPIIFIGRRVRAQGHEAGKCLAAVNSHAEETLGAVRTVQALVLETYENNRFTNLVIKSRKAALGRVRMRGFMVALVIFLVFGAIVTVLRFGGDDVISGRITLGDLSSFVFYAVLVATTLGALSESWMEIQRASGAGARLTQLLAMSPDIVSPNVAGPVLNSPTEGGVRVAFDDVAFAYPARPDKSAVQGITLDVKPGATIALVGPSGAGKTTLFQLMLRFYDPSAGRVLFNGVDIKDIPLPELRGLIGIVPQDPVIFSATARENIRLGNIHATDAEIIEAAKVASALEFLDKLPQGLDSHLGQKGIQLSGGQRQRLAIARAVVRNPRLLLLDEATSALDSENEHLIQKALERLMQGRTTFVIAHRLSTITKADQIVLMNHGAIEAIGTHRELLEKSKLYARLAELQFKTEI